MCCVMVWVWVWVDANELIVFAIWVSLLVIIKQSEFVSRWNYELIVFSDVSMEGKMGGESIDLAVLGAWLGGKIVDESWLAKSSANRTGCVSKLGITQIDSMGAWETSWCLSKSHLYNHFNFEFSISSFMLLYIKRTCHRSALLVKVVLVQIWSCACMAIAPLVAIKNRSKRWWRK